MTVFAVLATTLAYLLPPYGRSGRILRRHQKARYERLLKNAYKRAGGAL